MRHSLIVIENQKCCNIRKNEISLGVIIRGLNYTYDYIYNFPKSVFMCLCITTISLDDILHTGLLILRSVVLVAAVAETFFCAKWQVHPVDSAVDGH